MPVLKIQTNKQLESSETQAFLLQASSSVATILGKPERYVMIILEQNADMLFAASDKPVAYLELKSIGLPKDRTAEFSANLCTMIGEALEIAYDRIYIEFSDAQRQMWGWDSRTF